MTNGRAALVLPSLAHRFASFRLLYSMPCASPSSSRWPSGGGGAPTLSGAPCQSFSMPICVRPRVPARGPFLCVGVAAPGDRRRRWTNPDGDRSSGRRRWVREPEPLRRWVEAENVAADLSATVTSGDGGGEGDSFILVSHNILGNDNALRHCDLYSNIPFDVMKWDRRKELICQDIHNWNADLVCLQEVDRYNDLLSDLKREGYAGIFKRRTGDAVDGCAIFWRKNIFHLLEEKNIEFKSFGLRDNVAQICIFEFINEDEKNGHSIQNIYKESHACLWEQCCTLNTMREWAHTRIVCFIDPGGPFCLTCFIAGRCIKLTQEDC